MNDEAVRLRGVSKVYRLYRSPLYRFLDLFGWSPSGYGFYGEHEALCDVDLTVHRGEKLAIIGRNGAGKSTLLKVITGLVRPTAGTVDVTGRVSNLLQIGSGFHPEFTGRQNVFAGLAHQGIVGRAASALYDEVVAFAEIEEYIDQPMKTYSTGMCSRLMFSSAIAVTPDILIVDEILGVGDAYFAHKSFERMRELCTRQRTTLLLVTHDIYSALNLCDRFVWLDRGRLQFDGEGKSAIALYEASIKAQEEQRLRLEHTARFARGSAAGEATPRIHVLVRSRTGFALDAPLALDAIELECADGNGMRLPVATGADAWHLLPESSLGPVETVGGRAARALRPTGSIFHKAEWIVALPGDAPVERLVARWRYEGSDLADIVVFTPDREVMIEGELGSRPGWQEASFGRNDARGRSLAPQQQIDYGTGAVRIVSVQFLDALDREVVQARHGEPLIIRLRVRVDRALADRHVTVIIGFSRQGSAYNGSVYDPNRLLPDSDECTIDVRLDPLRFGSGQWYLNIGIGAPGLYEQPVVKYFTTDSAWYHLLAARLELPIASARGVDAVGCFVVHPAAISCVPASEGVPSR